MPLSKGDGTPTSCYSDSHDYAKNTSFHSSDHLRDASVMSAVGENTNPLKSDLKSVSFYSGQDSYYIGICVSSPAEVTSSVQQDS